MRLPSLKFLKTFQVAAVNQSFKAAADELCITPSAVSHQIKALEHQLGIVLFDRGPHSLALTEAGKHYLNSIDAIFSRLELVTEQLQVSYARNVVRLNVPSFFSSELLLPRLNEFLVEQPATDIHIQTAVLPTQIHAADADLSIAVGAPSVSGIVGYRLFDQAFVPACAPELLARHSIRSIDDLSNHTLLVHDARRDGWERFATMCGVRRLKPRNIVRLDTLHAVAEAAERGVGIALVSEPLTRKRFEEGLLVRLFTDALCTGESYYLLHRVEDSERRELRTLVEWLLRVFQEDERAKPDSVTRVEDCLQSA